MTDRITARETYERFYFLLPQYADEAQRLSWLVGLAPLIAHNLATVGFSADDAGNGEGLSRRIVFAINPQEIGTGLNQAWFDQYYPGAQMIGIEADTPTEFTVKWRGA